MKINTNKLTIKIRIYFADKMPDCNKFNVQNILTVYIKRAGPFSTLRLISFKGKGRFRNGFPFRSENACLSIFTLRTNQKV